MKHLSLAIPLCLLLGAYPAHLLAQYDNAKTQAEEEDVAAEEESDSKDEPAEAPPAKDGDDLESLRAEYFKLRDKLFQSRARAAAVSSALYSTRVSIDLNYESARYYTVTRSTIRLDGTNIYDDTEGSIGEDKATRFEGYIAPGRHQISIRIEATGKDDDRFTSVIDNSFIVQAVKDKDLTIRAKAKDSGDIAYKWQKSESGSYGLHLDISVKAVKRKGKSKHIKRSSTLTPTSTKERRG
jgi:hypothetical protein